AHPEFKSRPNQPAPLFREFVRASIAHHEGISRSELHVVGVPVITDDGIAPDVVMGATGE
ncbi:MAG: hypothetical protein IJH08_07640, partial [Atopobiaceae bacterium]|nr:hypothetical protein [Atopobiaceae bacterium]